MINSRFQIKSKLVFLLYFIVSFITLNGVSFAQDKNNLEVIKEIKITGQKKIEPDAIRAKMKSKTGDLANRKQIAEDIKAIHALGFFDDITFQLEGQILTVVVKERPTIVKIEFEGNDQVKSDDLKDVVKIKEYALLDINKVKEDIGLIQKYYEDKGFYLAHVTYEIVKTEKQDEVRLVYRVSDYEKVKIKKITFINNHVFKDEKLKGFMRNTKEGNFFSWASSSGNFKESAFKQDLQALTYFYLNEGYVKFRYENPVVTVSEDKKWLFISIYVDEGKQYTVNDIDFGGDLLFEQKELLSALSLNKGMTFSISKRNDDIQKLTEKYQDLGYAFVNVNPKMNIRDENLTVDMRYEFEKGNLVHFGEINILGNTKTRDKVIRRELRIREGELYNGTRLRVSRERIERLGFFAPGEVVLNQVTRKDNKDIVDIEINIKERSTGTITLGMGYGSIQKFFMTASIAEINLLGRGQNLSLSGQYAADRRSRSLSLGFTEPYAFDSLWSAGADVYLVSYPIPTRYLLYKKGGDLRFGHPVINDDMSAYITYKFENMKLDEVVAGDPELNVTDDRGNLSSIGINLVRDVRNNRFETTRGDYQSIGAELAGSRYVGGMKDFVKLYTEGRYYFPITEDLTFRTKAEFGQLYKTTNRNIPPAEKFFLGGPNNLKGFDTFSVGPKTAKGSNLGGVTQFLYIAEFEYPLIKEAGLKLVTFFDLGNSYSNITEFTKLLGFKKDVGFGFRWFSPIGPLRFEWGFPIAPKHGDPNQVVFNFFIGPPF